MYVKESIIKKEAQRAAPLFYYNLQLSILFIDSFPWQSLVKIGYA